MIYFWICEDGVEGDLTPEIEFGLYQRESRNLHIIESEVDYL